jgi:phage/plasmid-like protein (TIGR03299 family)
MAHLIDMSNARANMAYTGDKPWHGLGQMLNPDADLDTWIREAGFDWHIKKSPVTYEPQEGVVLSMPDRWVLSRSDTNHPLSVVSSNYRITQPRDVAEFFRELVTAGGFKMETMGMLKGGAMYWALAKADDSFDLGAGDDVLPYVLVATSADGTLSNCAAFTTIRVVCWNTLSASVGGRGAAGKGEAKGLRIPHSTEFKPEIVKQQLGLIPMAWDQFKSDAKELTKVEVSREQAMDYFLKVLYPKQDSFDLAVKRPALDSIVGIYEGGVGQLTKTAHNTAWGLVNAITRFTDHEKPSANNDYRLQSAWFGAGDALKRRAWDAALELIAA